jgi:hypothetical protein
MEWYVALGVHSFSIPFTVGSPHPSQTLIFSSVFRVGPFELMAVHRFHRFVVASQQTSQLARLFTSADPPPPTPQVYFWYLVHAAAKSNQLNF